MRKAVVLGCSGSIGRQALEVLSARPDEFTVIGLSCDSSIDFLLESGARFPEAALCLSGSETPIDGVRFSGSTGLIEMIGESGADIVVNGISGAAGFLPSLAAVRIGADLALANKETMVAGGRFVLDEARASGAKVLPVDSEHAALFWMLDRIEPEQSREIVLTASGGAFRDLPPGAADCLGPEEALQHPTWSMGPKITVDSATLANKGLEVMEAARLFGFPARAIKVLIHRQSIVHALVRTRDGALLAYLSGPDMRLPIDQALSWPSCSHPYGELPLDRIGTLDFEEPTESRYPLLALAYDALSEGEGSCIAFNAANEVAVKGFLERAIRFGAIADIVRDVVENNTYAAPESAEAVMEIHALARSAARSCLERYAYRKV